MNQTVILECKNSGERDAVAWLFKAVGSNKEEFLKDRLNNVTRWSVNESEGYSQLIIADIKPEDAGLLICITGKGQYSSQLVILGNWTLIRIDTYIFIQFRARNE